MLSGKFLKTLDTGRVSFVFSCLVERLVKDAHSCIAAHNFLSPRKLAVG